MTPGRTVAFGLAAAAVVLSACFPGWPPEDKPDLIGLSADGSRVRVFFPECEGVLVRYVELRPQGEEAIWRISARDGSPLREFTIGTTPPGFHEDIALVNPRWEGHHLLIVDNTLRTGETAAFSRGDLKQGEILVGYREYLSREEYRARQVC